MDYCEKLESNVRSYCRSFPVVFRTAEGATLTDARGRRYLDFLAGAGTLNYGHNHPVLKQALLEYIASNGVTHGLDMATTAKERFLETFARVILEPRGLRYKVQFTGPTGTNAVEAALKLARKYTGRSTVVAFTNGYHGLTMGSLASTGNNFYRTGLEPLLSNTVFLPFYDYYDDEHVSAPDMLRAMLGDASSGIDVPAAVIVETVQGEGGVNVASFEWLRELRAVCTEHDILLIVDDIQMGCGRTESFFSFEGAGIVPDIVVLSKSLSGYGLPFAVVLMQPHLDMWEPGEHTGTFRGNNHAFVTAAVALEQFWTNGDLMSRVGELGNIIEKTLVRWTAEYPELEATVRGRGLIWGLDSAVPELGPQMSRAAFENGLIIETAGAESQVLKFLPPLTIAEDELREGLQRIEAGIPTALRLAPAHT